MIAHTRSQVHCTQARRAAPRPTPPTIEQRTWTNKTDTYHVNQTKYSQPPHPVNPNSLAQLSNNSNNMYLAQWSCI